MKHQSKRFGRFFVQTVVVLCCMSAMLLCINCMTEDVQTPKSEPGVSQTDVQSKEQSTAEVAQVVAEERDAASEAPISQPRASMESDGSGVTRSDGNSAPAVSHSDVAVEHSVDGGQTVRAISESPQETRVFHMPQDALFVPDVVLVSVEKDACGASAGELLGGRDFVTVEEDSMRWISSDLVEFIVAQGFSVEDAVNEFETSGVVDGAQPDYIYGVQEEHPALIDAITYVAQIPSVEEPAVSEEQNVEGEDAEDGFSAIAAEESVESDGREQGDANVVATDETVQDDEDGFLATAETSSDDAVDDLYYDMQWGLRSMNVPEAWANGAKTERSVGVAVIDSGFVVGHEDLKGIIPDGAPYNAYRGSQGETDPDKLADVEPTFDKEDPQKSSPEHGMHVAGIVAAQANNGKGIAGVSHNATLIPIRAFNYGVSGVYGATVKSLVRSFDYVFEKQDEYNIRVINMSIGAKTDALKANDEVLKKIDEAYKRGIVTVCSGGNSTFLAIPPFINYPSDYATIVSAINLRNLNIYTENKTVGGKSYLDILNSTDYTAVGLSSTSNFNAEGEMAKNISAPGSQILSTTTSDSNIRAATVPYDLMSGTSMAAPQISGVLALMFSKKPDVPKNAAGAQYMVDMLYSSARKLTDKDFDLRYGYGEADAFSAVQAVDGPYLDGPAYVSVGQADIVFKVDSGIGWEFASSDPGVLSVDSSGTSCVANAPGQVLLSATRGSQKLRKTVTVVGGFKDSHFFAVGSKTTIAVDQPTMLMWEWKSSDTEVATVTSPGGTFIPTKAGTTTVTATLTTGGGVASDCVVSEDMYVVGPLSGDDTIAVGKSTQLDIEVPAGISLEDFEWATDDDGVASVDAHGKVTGVAAGDALITAILKEEDGLSKSVQFGLLITVRDNIPMSDRDMSISPIANQVYAGVPATPEPTITWNNTTLVRDTDYVLTYRDNAKPGEASVVVEGKGHFTGARIMYFSIDSAFIDVTEKTAHVEDIAWLAQTGISEGWKNDAGMRSFRPASKVARADMAAFLYRLANMWGLVDKDWQPMNTAEFRDVTSTTPHANEILWLAEEGISQGWTLADDSKEFRPLEAVARQDMAAFLFRLAKLAQIGGASDTWTASKLAQRKFRDVNGNNSSNHHVEVWWLAETGVSEGWSMGDGTYEFRGLQAVARQDMAAFLHRLDSLRKRK